jgi:ABC-type transport system involved in multi-copper enzyme maturation permease subunit
MTNAWSQVRTIAAKEISDARRTSLLVVIAGFMLLAGSVALIVAALSFHGEIVTYNSSKELLLSLGKPVNALIPPAFFPLKLLRGFVEYIEIIGAVLGIVLGYRAAAVERGRNTLPLILTRPLSQSTLIGGKLLGNAALIAFVLSLTFLLGTIGIIAIGRIGLSGTELLKLLLTDLSAILYVTAFFVLGFFLSLHMRRLPHALLAAFTVWLSLVLIAPQIGDTLDPDNQLPGGLFRTLGIPKPQEKEILLSFKSYETIRDGIEQASPAKHFERLSFALTGIKDIYNGEPIGKIMSERRVDLIWLFGILAAMLAILFTRRLNFTNLAKD